jgi:hypothetical protein
MDYDAFGRNLQVQRNVLHSLAREPMLKATQPNCDDSHRAIRRFLMQAIHAGQCGLCTHFGESHHSDKALISIMTTKQANLDMLDECGHPKHASLHLKVTPISGCDGFIPAASA